jgi:hypothetical protein
MERQHLRYLSWAAAAVLLLALTPLPYGYYQFLRIAVCLIGIAIAVDRYSARALPAAAISAVAAIVFNPIAPLHFEREIWALLNVVAAVCFIVISFTLRRGGGDGAGH